MQDMRCTKKLVILNYRHRENCNIFYYKSIKDLLNPKHLLYIFLLVEQIRDLKKYNITKVSFKIGQWSRNKTNYVIY